jgi:serine/threonine protein kinase
VAAQGASRSVGSVIDGKYELEGVLGEGGMGVVYRARHRWTHRPVALKVLNAEAASSEESIARFMREARSAAALRHPNVVDVLDMGRDEGGVYLALELLEGDSLGRALQRAVRLPLDETLRYLLPVMDALAAAHRHGIVHRDLKPDNILLARTEKGEIVPKLLDFGIAKVRTATNSVSTQAGLIIGTPAYMSPEQIRGAEHVGVPTDIWAMGVVAYECLSGVSPFREALPQVSLVRILTETIPPLELRVRGLPSAVAKAIHRALEKDPNDRFASIDELANALRSAAGLASDFGRTPVSPSSRPETALALSSPAPPNAGSGVVPRPALGQAGDAPADVTNAPDSLSTLMPKRRWIWPLAIAAVVALSLGAWLLGSRDTEPPAHLVTPGTRAPNPEPPRVPPPPALQRPEPPLPEPPTAQPPPVEQPRVPGANAPAAHRSRSEHSPRVSSRPASVPAAPSSQPAPDMHNPVPIPAPSVPTSPSKKPLGSERRAPELDKKF